jgi:hypothetical protein
MNSRNIKQVMFGADTNERRTKVEGERGVNKAEYFIPCMKIKL